MILLQQNLQWTLQGPLLHTSRSPRVGSGPWQLKISWLSVKSGLKTMERNSGVVTGAAPPPGTPGTSGPAGLRFRSQGWMKSTSLADPTGTALGGGLVSFFSKKHSTKKNKKQKKSYHHTSAAWCPRFSCTITSRTTDYRLFIVRPALERRVLRRF